MPGSKVVVKNVASSSSDLSTLLWNVNHLLSAVGITGKRISSISELSRVSSSLFVAVFEALFKTRLEGVHRGPKSKESYAQNVQRVVEAMSQHINMDLQHIKGKAIVQGDLRALSNLVHIFVRIVSIAGEEQSSPGDDDEEEDAEFLIDNDDRDVMLGTEGDSISTHESTFGERERDEGLRVSPSRVRRLWSRFDSEQQQLLTTTEAQLQHDADQEMLKRRARQNSSSTRGRVANLLHNKWTSDEPEQAGAGVGSGSSSEERTMLRSVYSNLLGRMHTMESIDRAEQRERRLRIRDEAKAVIESLHREFSDRAEMLRAQIVSARVTAGRHDDAQKIIGAKLKTVYQERQERMAENHRHTFCVRRKHYSSYSKEAHKNLVSLKSAEH